MPFVCSKCRPTAFDSPKEDRSLELEAKVRELNEKFNDLTTKFDHLLQRCASFESSNPTPLVSDKKSFAEIVKGSKELKTQNRFAALEMLQERENRDKNLIIHGCEEGLNEDAQVVAKELLSAAGLYDVTPTSVVRLGPKKDGKIRPLRAILHDKETRDQCVKAGRVLGEKKIKARFLPDRTPEERQQINSLFKEAKERNVEGHKKAPKKGFLWMVMDKLHPHLLQVPIREGAPSNV